MIRANKLAIYFIIGVFVTIMLAAFDVPNGAGPENQRDLSIGKVGGDVRQLQIALDKRGYDLKPFDGIFGLRTQQAVIDLQKKNGIKPTGVVDSETREALNGRKRNDAKPAKKVDTVSRGMSRDEVMMLARVVHGEARGEPFEGQVAVAAVVLNRARSGQFPDSINGVVFEPGAFDAVSDGQIWLDPDQKSIKAAELALAGYDPTGNALYYWNPAKATNKWIWSRPVQKQIGQHVFAK